MMITFELSSTSLIYPILDKKNGNFFLYGIENVTPFTLSVIILIAEVGK